jgi:VanZ family protein
MQFPFRRPDPIWRWLFLLTYAALVTTALLVPIRVRSLGLESVGSDVLFSVAKSIHVLGYAVFAILGGWLRAPLRWRWLVLFLVMAHGTVMELLQTLTPTRSGTLQDVGFDNLGVALGLMISWKWWTAPESPPVQRPDSGQDAR